MNRLLLIFAIPVIAFTGTGCPPLPTPPFDATGTFVGTWAPQSEEAKGVLCPVTFVIDHNIEQEYPRNLGMEIQLTIDLSCHPDVQAVVDAGLNPVLVLETRGVLDPRGQFISLAPPCETEPCVSAVFGGEGFDDDGDGQMDAATGDIGITVAVAEVDVFEMDADFELVRQ